MRTVSVAQSKPLSICQLVSLSSQTVQVGGVGSDTVGFGVGSGVVGFGVGFGVGSGVVGAGVTFEVGEFVKSIGGFQVPS